MYRHSFHDVSVFSLVGIAIIDTSHFVVVAVIEKSIHRLSAKSQTSDGSAARAPQVVRRYLIALRKTNGRANVAQKRTTG